MYKLYFLCKKYTKWRHLISNSNDTYVTFDAFETLQWSTTYVKIGSWIFTACLLAQVYGTHFSFCFMLSRMLVNL